MTTDERIKRIERAMKFEQEKFDWLNEHEWGSSDDEKIALRTTGRQLSGSTTRSLGPISPS